MAGSDSYLPHIYAVFLAQELAAKRYEMFEKEFLDLVAEDGSPRQGSNGSKFPALQDLITLVLVESEKSPQVAKDLLPLSGRLLKATWKDGKLVDDPVAASVWSMALFLHLFADDEASWGGREDIGYPLDDEFVGWATLPSRAFAIFGKSFRKPEHKQFRLRVGHLFLASPWVQERISRMPITGEVPSYVSTFTLGMGVDDLQNFFNGLVVDSPCAHLYRFFIGKKLMRLKLQVAGRVNAARIKVYQEACENLEIAKELSENRKADRLTNLIDADLRSTRFHLKNHENAEERDQEREE